MSINANTSVLEYERLTTERTQGRLARKAINKRRYLRQYMRRGGFTRALMVRVSDIVTATINLHVYGPIGSDNLL